MPRSAIVIGVGGTGSWVLSWLKKDLIETHGSLKGLPVRLLLLDVADIIAEVGNVGTALQQGQTSSVSGGQYSRFINIDPDLEFIRLPTSRNTVHTRDIARTVAKMNSGTLTQQEQEQYERDFGHLSRWFCADFFPENALGLTDGAGKFRQLGRLSLVQGIHLNGSADQVYTMLHNMITSVARSQRVGESMSVDVHIAGSFAGGTGSGVFLDIAWLIRKIAESSGVDAFITGFFAMPQVFGLNPTAEMRTKAFSAWRELNRMISIERNNTDFQVAWGKSPDTIFEVTRPTYDHIYLIDSAPQTTAMNYNPSESVFPIIAEAISFFLDKNSGHQYIQHIRTNVAAHKQQSQFRNKPTYSTLYVKSWKLPIFHHVNVARHTFALTFLTRLLDIVEDQEVTQTNTVRTVYRLAPQADCGARINEIFQGLLGDNNVGSTEFVELQEQIRQIPHPNRPMEARSWADYASNLLNLYAVLPNDAVGNQIRQQLAPLVEYGIPAYVPTDHNREMHGDIQDIHNRLYGVGGIGGEYQSIYGDLRGQRVKGKLFNELQAVHDFQMDTFRLRLRTWMDRELNSGAGSLACVLSAVRALRNCLDENIKFLKIVQESLPLITETESTASAAFTYALNATRSESLMSVMASKVGVGEGKKRVQDWYHAETVHQSAMCNHRAVERMILTVEEMFNYVSQVVLPKIEEMEQQLVTDNNYDRITGLYRGVVESLRDEYDRHAFDQNLGSVTVLLEGEQQRAQVDEREIERLLQRTKWSIDERMSLKIEISVSDTSEPIVLESKVGDTQQTIRLVKRLIEEVADRVVITQSSQTALEVIGVPELGRQLRDCNRTLFRASARGGEAHDSVRTFYVRCGTRAGDASDGSLPPDTENAVMSVIHPMGLPSQPPHEVAVVGSENPNKIVVFSAQEVLLPENFTEWDLCRQHYQSQVAGDARANIRENYLRIRCDHLFAAEKNALALEYFYYRDTGLAEFPILNYRVVHLLENLENLRDFMYLWAMDWITERQQGRERYWTIVPPEPEPPVDLSLRSNNDALTVMMRYATAGRDVRGRAINYDRLNALFNRALDHQWLATPESSAELLWRFEYESKMAAQLAEVIDSQLRLSGQPEDIKNALDHVVNGIKAKAETGESGPYRSTLAEALAYDFARRGAGESLFVTNPEAHMQMLEIVLCREFDELARQIRNFRMDQRWE